MELNGAILSEPCASENFSKVFVATLAGKIYCIEIENCKIFWSIEIPKPIFGGISSLEGKKILVPCVDGKIYCLNQSDGEIVSK